MWRRRFCSCAVARRGASPASCFRLIPVISRDDVLCPTATTRRHYDFLFAARKFEKLAGDSFDHADGRSSPVARTGRAIIAPAGAPTWTIVGAGSVSDTPRHHEPLLPIRLLDAVTPDSSIALARLDHHAVALVQSDVRDERPASVCREEEKIAGLKSANVLAELRLVDSPPREKIGRASCREGEESWVE